MVLCARWDYTTVSFGLTLCFIGAGLKKGTGKEEMKIENKKRDMAPFTMVPSKVSLQPTEVTR